MEESKRYRFRLNVGGVELATERRYTKDEIEDIHRLTKNVALIAVVNDKVEFTELQEVPA